MRSERSSRSAQVLGWGVILVMGLGWLAAARAEELPGLRQAVTNVFLTTPAEPPRSPTVEELRVVFETVVRERPLRYYICGRVYPIISFAWSCNFTSRSHSSFVGGQDPGLGVAHFSAAADGMVEGISR